MYINILIYKYIGKGTDHHIACLEKIAQERMNIGEIVVNKILISLLINYAYSSA